PDLTVGSSRSHTAGAGPGASGRPTYEALRSSFIGQIIRVTRRAGAAITLAGLGGRTPEGRPDTSAGPKGAREAHPPPRDVSWAHSRAGDRRARCAAGRPRLRPSKPRPGRGYAIRFGNPD